MDYASLDILALFLMVICSVSPVQINLFFFGVPELWFESGAGISQLDKSSRREDKETGRMGHVLSLCGRSRAAHEGVEIADTGRWSRKYSKHKEILGMPKCHRGRRETSRDNGTP